MLRHARVFIAVSLSLFLIVCGCLAYASAEERFEIRKGIYLGDTFEEVISKNDLGFENEDYENYKEDDDGLYCLWTNKGRIAGYDNTQVRYTFKDKVLIDVIYNFEDTSDKDTVDDQYKTLVSALKRKYGNALGNTGGTTYIIAGEVFNYALFNVYFYSELLDGVGDYRDYDEWTYTELPDYNVKIDIISTYYGASYSEVKYENNIGYHLYTDDELGDAVAEKQAENAERDSDL